MGAVVLPIIGFHTLVSALRSVGGEEGEPKQTCYFGTKDLFTVVNLLGGVLGIHYALEGNVLYAGYAIFAGYLFGDVLDGPFARWSNTANRFGAAFDRAVDHLSQAIAPALVAYVGFAQAGERPLGLLVMTALIASASFRQARANAGKFDCPIAYCGLPRTVSGIIAISYPNSTLFFEYSSIPYEAAAALLVLVAALNVSPVPYMTHRGARPMQLYVKLAVIAFLTGPIALVFVAPEYVFDALFVMAFSYALGAWLPLRANERREFRTEYKRWLREISRSG